jgi:hypothetical protein
VAWEVDVVNDADVATLWEECAEAQRAQRHVRLYVAQGEGVPNVAESAERTPPPRSAADAAAEATRDGTTELGSPMSAPSPLHDDGGASLCSSACRTAPRRRQHHSACICSSQGPLIAHWAPSRLLCGWREGPWRESESWRHPLPRINGLNSRQDRREHEVYAKGFAR